MSKFNVAIESLRMAIGELEYEEIWGKPLIQWSVVPPQELKAEQEFNALVEQHEQAIAILESWPKWEPLIEAAKKVDKQLAIEGTLAWSIPSWNKHNADNIEKCEKAVKFLLESIPEEEK
jgi:hypothetical protein